MDYEILVKAVEAFEILDSGHLPDEGSFLDQTQFFAKTSVIVKHKIKELEAESYEVNN